MLRNLQLWWDMKISHLASMYWDRRFRYLKNKYGEALMVGENSRQARVQRMEQVCSEWIDHVGHLKPFYRFSSPKQMIDQIAQQHKLTKAELRRQLPCGLNPRLPVQDVVVGAAGDNSGPRGRITQFCVKQCDQWYGGPTEHYFTPKWTNTEIAA